MALRAVIFDLGGTIAASPGVNTELRAAQYALARPLLETPDVEWVPDDEELIEAIGFAIEQEIERHHTGKDRQLQDATSSLVARVFSTLGLRVDPDVIEAYTEIIFDETGVVALAPVASEARAVLEALKLRGLKLGLFSNTMLTARGLNAVLEGRQLGGLFDVALASSALGYRKPDARCFEAVLSALELRPNECIFVGDEVEADIYGAKALGMRAVQTIEYRADEQEPIATPDFVISRLEELLPYVDKLLAS